jgi:hypothetical protein
VSRDGHAAHEALGGGHRDGAGDAVAKVLLHLQREALLLAGDGEVNGQGLINGRDGVLGELHVDDGTDDLDDFASVAHDLNGSGVSKGIRWS